MQAQDEGNIGLRSLVVVVWFGTDTDSGKVRGHLTAQCSHSLECHPNGTII